jgi:hypothetical protein
VDARFVTTNGAVEVQSDVLGELYDLLWLLVPARGAVSAAAKVRHAQQFPRDQCILDEYESAAFLEAAERLYTARSD